MAKKKNKISGSAYIILLQDHFEILRRAYESYLVLESFSGLLSDVHREDAEYPRVRFFTDLILATVSAAFDSYVINLHKFYDSRSHCLEHLVDVGVEHEAIPPWLETIVRKKIKKAAACAANKHIQLLRNRNVGHYRITNQEHSPLTTIDPRPEEVRDYFARIGEILKLCADHAPLSNSPLRYNQFERQITATAGMAIRYFRGEKAP